MTEIEFVEFLQKVLECNIGEFPEIENGVSIKVTNRDFFALLEIHLTSGEEFQATIVKPRYTPAYQKG